MIIGSVIGAISARRVKMTAMPEMVSLFNGMGGLCAALISVVELGRIAQDHSDMHVLSILAGMVIGSVSFTGSMDRLRKTQGQNKKDRQAFRGQHLVNLLVLLLIIVAGVVIIDGDGTVSPVIFWRQHA